MTDLGPADDRMSDVDKILWVIEANPQLRSTITVVLFFDRPPDRALLNTRVERATRRVGRLRQRVVSNPYSLAPPRWEVDPAFNLSYHLRWAHLGGSGTPRDVLALAEPIAMQSFDKARPLWELTVVEGLEHDVAAVVAKIHHTITDGVGGVQLMLELFDLERDPSSASAMPPTPKRRVLNQRERFRDAMLHELQRRHSFAMQATGGLVDLARDPVDGARRTVETALSALRMAQPTTRPMSPLLEAKSLNVRFHSFDRRLDDFRTAARAVDATVNDVFVTGLCRGLARWHVEQGVPLSALRMGMPINARRPGDEATSGANQFLPTRFEVPLGVSEVAGHVQEVSRRIRTQRDEAALGLVAPLAGVLSRLPRFVLTNLFSGLLRGQDFLASNVPGAPVPVYFAGAEMTSMVAFGPLSGTALNITLFSHCRNVHIGISHDPEAIPDGDALVACIEYGIDEVLSLGHPAPAPAPEPSKAKNRKARR
jgi:diacylglycerol O-acyltransferase